MEQKDETSVLWLYKRLLELRRATPALNIGSYQPLNDTPENVFGYWREANESKILVLLSLSAEEQEVSLPSEVWCVTLSTQLDRNSKVENTLQLRPYEGVILQPN